MLSSFVDEMYVMPGLYLMLKDSLILHKNYHVHQGYYFFFLWTWTVLLVHDWHKARLEQK